MSHPNGCSCGSPECPEWQASQAMSHPSGLTCDHRPEGSGILCPACREEYDEDPSAWLEFGNHPEGNRRWEELQAEMDAFYKANPPSSVSEPDDTIPF